MPRQPPNGSPPPKRRAPAPISSWLKPRLRRIEALLNYASITAPFSGTISRRLVDPGALVMAGDTSGGPILAVVRTDRLRLVLDIP